MKKESEYRKINRLSYSSLKLYNQSPLKYYKKYILKEVEKDKTQTFLIGNIVDVMMTDTDNFDDYFVISKAVVPTGQLYTFINYTIELGHSSKAYEKLKNENGGKLGSDLDKFIANVDGKAKEYYDELLKSIGKTLITQEQYDLCKAICVKIDNSQAFKSKGTEFFKKFVHLFVYNSVEMKCEIDEFSIDHDKKKVYLYDYKCTGQLDRFVWEGYLKLNYYIQASLYKYALQDYINSKYTGYTIEPMAFKVVDDTNELEPLLFQTTEGHYDGGFTGFYVGNNYYKGIDQLLAEMETSLAYKQWGMSIYNYNNKGIVTIPEFKKDL